MLSMSQNVSATPISYLAMPKEQCSALRLNSPLQAVRSMYTSKSSLTYVVQKWTEAGDFLLLKSIVNIDFDELIGDRERQADEDLLKHQYRDEHAIL
jgi:hypothetical protein